VPSSGRPVLTVGFWRSRRSAAVAGIIFAILILIALVMTRIALTEVTLDALRADPERRRLIRISLNLVPFAGIAFLWFIGVIRDQLGDVEDRLFSTVFLGSGLLFLAMLFSGTVTLTGLMEVVATTDPDVGVYGFGRSTTQTLVSVYAMRMAAVFTLSVSTVGIRTRSLPRWVSYLGYVVALTLMVAAGEHKWTQLVFPTWVLLVSVVLLLVRPPVRSGTPITPGTPVTPGTPD
jgi:hypothetical protein